MMQMTTKHSHIYKAMRTLFSIAALLLICGCSEQGNDQEKLLDDTVCLIEQYQERCSGIPCRILSDAAKKEIRRQSGKLVI